VSPIVDERVRKNPIVTEGSKLHILPVVGAYCLVLCSDRNHLIVL
jgi:hypothetical protein